MHRLVLSMVCAGLCSVLVDPRDALAEAALTGLGDREVREVSHETRIELFEDRFAVDETMTIAAMASGDTEVVYTFDLPAQAAMRGASVRLADGRTTRFTVVGAQTALRDGFEDSDIDAAEDIGLLRMVGHDLSADARAFNTYELRVYPLSARKAAVVSLAWDAPVSRLDGGLHLRIPGRGDANNLVRQSVQLVAKTALHNVYAAGASRPGDQGRLSVGESLQVTAPVEGDLVIQAALQKPPVSVQAEVGLVAFGPTSGAAVVRVNMPTETPRRPASYGRVLLAIDISRSTSGSRREIEKLVDQLLGKIGTGAQVEAILFDRRASRVLGALRPADREARVAISQALAAAGSKNGSNLAAALDTIAAITETSGDASDKTLIAIVTDAMLDTQLSGDEALRRLGKKALASSQIVNIVMVPDEAPVPDLSDSALSELAHRTGGRCLPMRSGEVNEKADQLLSLIAREAPIGHLEVELGSARWVGAELPNELRSGEGALALGFYEGKMPSKVSVRAVRDGRVVRFSARPMSKERAEVFARMALAHTGVGAFPLEEATRDRASDKKSDQHKAASIAMLKTTNALGVVTQESTAVLVDSSDGFARDRIALAEKWGPQYYRRVRPPPEKAVGHVFRPLRPLRSGTSTESAMPTGTLSRSLVKRLIQAHVLPNARRCYNKMLRKDPSVHGTMTLYLELARGEVHHASISESPVSLAGIHDCVVDAAYDIPVPAVRLGSDAETISVARYPLRFRLKPDKNEGVVDDKLPEIPMGELDPDDPLSGLPED